MNIGPSIPPYTNYTWHPPDATHPQGAWFVEASPLQCQEGYHWDGQANACVPDNVDTTPAQGPDSCKDGLVWDPVTLTCIPGGPSLTVNSPSGGITGTATQTAGVTGTGAGNVNVTVSQAVSLADNSASNAIDNVTAAVQQAIGQATAQGTAVADATGKAVAQAINNYAYSVQNGVNSAFTGIGDVLAGVEQGLTTTLGGIGQQIGNNILGSLNPITIQLAGIAATISQQIGGLAGAVAQSVAAILPQIVAIIANPIQGITGVLGTIERDIAANVAGLTQVGSDISGGFTSLDATLGRVLSEWETYNTGFIENTTGYGTGETLHKDLSGLAAALAGLVTTLAGAATPKASEFLAPPCNSPTVQKLLEAPYDFGNTENSFFKGVGLALWTFVLNLAKIVPAVLKVNEIVSQDVNRDCPSGLLPISAVVDAEMRGFITHLQAVAEAAKGDIDETRLKTLRDLATNQMSPSQLVEALYRSIVQPGDYATALAAQGWTPGQQNILQALAVELLSVPQLTELFRRGLVDTPTMDQALKSLRYDDAQRKALLNLALRPPHMQEAIDGGVALDALSQIGLLGETDTNRIPEYVQIAALAEGLGTDAMNQRWLEHWQVGPVAAWVNLYFRGLVPVETVRAVMGRSYIPQAIQTTLIEASRPLVQYRTISSMLRIGQLTDNEAGQLLKQHGYSDQSVQLLINYAKRPGAAVAAKKAQTAHAVSIDIAKREYVDGSISENDYYQVLLAHGYTIDGANTEIAVENANQAMLARKAEAQFVVDEYGAGLIDEKTALAQLAAFLLTPQEFAKYTHKIRAFRVKNAKLPSEPDLNHFLQLSIIDADTYRAQLKMQGYSSNAADWFYQWRTNPSSTTGASVAATPSPTGG